jgi:hypothetical protein
MTALEAQKTINFWLARVNDPYDWGMILGSAPIFLVKLLIGLFSERLAAKTVRHMPNFLAHSNLSTCAELGIRGMRVSRQTVLTGYEPEKVDPEILRTHPGLHTDAVLVAPILVD